MAGEHSSLPWARTFGIINKNAVTISWLEFFILLVWSNQLEKKFGLHIYIYIYMYIEISIDIVRERGENIFII